MTKGPKYKSGDKVIIYDSSWEEGDLKIRVRGTVLGSVVKRKGEAEGIERATRFYHVKPNLRDVRELWGTDYEEYMEKYNHPYRHLIPGKMLKPLGSKNLDWGYYEGRKIDWSRID